MNRTTSRRAALALGIATALAMAAGTQVSTAQTPPRALPNLQNQQQDPQYDRRDDRQSGGQQYGGQYDQRSGRGAAYPAQRLDRRLAFLHTQLHITPAQERTWTSFANVLRSQARNPGRDRNFDDRRGPSSVVQRLEERQQMLADRSADLNRVMQALRPLFASFNEEQKRTADRLMFMPGGERFGGRGLANQERGGPDFGRGGPQTRFDDRQDRNNR